MKSDIRNSIYKFKKNKKGDIGDLLFMGIALFVFSIILLFGYKLTDAFNTEVQGMEVMESHAKNATINLNNTFPGVLDNSFLFLTVILAIAAIVMAAMVRISPIFLAAYIILLTFIIFLSALFSNVYQEMAATDQLTTLAADLTFTSYIMSWLPLIVGVFGSLLAIVMYKSWQEAQL